MGLIKITGGGIIEKVGGLLNGQTVKTTNGDILVNTQGTGKVDFQTGKQSTVGTAGTASALPGQPEGYLIIKVDGVSRVLPFYKQS